MRQCQKDKDVFYGRNHGASEEVSKSFLTKANQCFENKALIAGESIITTKPGTLPGFAFSGGNNPERLPAKPGSVPGFRWFSWFSLERLREAERLSETFMRNLLSWVHPGFSIFAGPAVDRAAGVAAPESQSRYITH